MTLADLLHGPRWAIFATIPEDPQPETVPGRYWSRAAADQHLPEARDKRNGRYRYARLEVAEVTSRRQRSRGPVVGVTGVGRWAA